MNNDALRWMHLSDFHFGLSRRYDQDVVSRALLNSYADIIQRTGPIDFILVTGDIANTGKSQEYELATLFFDRLLSLANLGRDRIFVVPGNHDVDRQASRGLLRTLTTASESQEYFSPLDPLPHLQKFSNYITWYDEYFFGFRAFDQNSTCGKLLKFSLKGRTIGISEINSALFCIDDNDHGKLFIGRRSIDRYDINELQECDIALALMHHPLDWLSEVEGASIRSRLAVLFDCICHGHLHTNNVGTFVQPSASCVHLAAGASYQGSAWPNTATIVELSERELLVTPIRYNDQPNEVWSIDTSLYPREVNYAGRVPLPRPTGETTRDETAMSTSVIDDNAAVIPSSASSLAEDLFTSADGAIYVEPRVMTQPQDALVVDGTAAERVTVAEIAKASSSVIVETRSEYGGTTLGKAVASELKRIGQEHVFYRDARELPTYRRKLESSFPFEAQKDASSILILDNFDVERDERLLKELSGTTWFKRFVIISVNRGLQQARTIDPGLLNQDLKCLYLWPLGREEIRSAAVGVFQSSSDSLISEIVDKVYDDLLELCIPLTPPTVLMYLKVLHREGDFQPLNRVDIVSRYIQEALRRPTDAYQGAFNVKNKLDVLSSFFYKLFSEDTPAFRDKDWHDFCHSYKISTLSDFDERVFLDELLEARVFSKSAGYMYPKYGFFYAYFLGRQLAVKPSLLPKFLEGDEVLRLRGVVDVVTGISSDNVETVRILTDKLDSYLNQFFISYIKPEFDPLKYAIWPDNSIEDEVLWKPISKEIEAGPQSTQKIDLLKTSIRAEARTADQEVRFSEFTDLENALFATALLLSDALRNSDDISGSDKVRAYEAILKARRTVFQVGCVFADLLAERQYFRWGGVTFLDFDRAAAGTAKDSPDRMIAMIDALSNSVAFTSAKTIGTKKLSAVFRAREQATEHMDYLGLLNFSAILRSKGPQWEKSLSHLIEITPKNSFYLWAIIKDLMDNFKHEIMLAKDREALKRLIAQVEAKRTFKKEAPGARAVSKMLEHLESIKRFDLPDS